MLEVGSDKAEEGSQNITIFKNRTSEITKGDQRPYIPEELRLSAERKMNQRRKPNAARSSRKISRD